MLSSAHKGVRTNTTEGNTELVVLASFKGFWNCDCKKSVGACFYINGKDRIGHFRSVINSNNESKQEYKISFDEGDIYSDKGVYAVQVEASDADEVLSQTVSDLAQPALSTEVEGRLGGVEGCSPQSN